MVHDAFINLIRNTPAYLSLERDFEKGRLSHAYLLNAPDRLAGKLIMEQFAETVLGKESAPVDAARIPADGAETILVHEIDAMLAGFPKRPSRGDRKFYLIDRAETMSAQCQNKLLKTLEEPQSGVCIILSARTTHKILPTILSRCRVLDIRPFQNGELTNAVKEVYGDAERAGFAAALSGGSLEDADGICRDEKKIGRFRLVMDILANTKSSKDVLLAVSRLANIKEKAQLSEVVQYFELVLRDVAVIHAGQNHALMLKGFETELAALSALYSLKAVLKILPYFNKFRRRQQLNANQNSLLDELVFTIVQVRATA